MHETNWKDPSQIGAYVLAILIISCTVMLFDLIYGYQSFSNPDLQTTQFIISINIAFLIPITIIISNNYTKKNNQKWVKSIISSNMCNILHYAKEIQDIHDNDKLDFKPSKGVRTRNFSIGDYLLRLSNNIIQTINFAYTSDMVNNKKLTQNIIDVLPELHPMLIGLYPFDNDLLNKNFKNCWPKFHDEIIEFCEYIIKTFDGDLINSNDLTCSYIKHLKNKM